jgi:nitrite reductase/ring-hydroxylating ferredoxin subunit
VGAGVVGAVGAAATGITDWQHTHADARRLGLVHGLLNATALALQVTSWHDRRRSRLGRARLLGAAGYAVVVASGYLGGALVFRHGIGTSHADEQLEPREFVPVLGGSELEEDRPRRVEADGVALCLVRSQGRVFAVGQSCAHLGAPMSEGWLHRGQLVCPWHGSRFRLDDGEPVSGPATAPLASYDVRVRAGQVEVRRAPRVPTATPGSTVAAAKR